MIFLIGQAYIKYNIYKKVINVSLFIWAIFCLICFILVKSIYEFVLGKKSNINLKESRFSSEIFYTLLVVYLTALIGFGLIYFILSFEGIILVEHAELKGRTIWDSLSRAFYFSGVTLLTIGYGDIVPIGIGRLLAVIQALIGYVLPAAFVLRIVILSNERARS